MPTHTFRRTSTADDTITHQALIHALQPIQDVTITDTGKPIHAIRRGRMLKNRYGMTAEITVNNSIITTKIDGLGSMQAKYFGEIEAGLPAGMIYDHGIAAATAQMNKSERFFGGAEMSQLLNEMQPNETVVFMTSANADGSACLIVLTTLRVLFMDRKLTESKTREIDPKQITSISTGKAMTGESLELTVSGAVIKVSLLPHGRGVEFANALRDTKAASSAPQAPQQFVAAPAVDTDQLTKLAELHASGILTDEEFATAKAKALGL